MDLIVAVDKNWGIGNNGTQPVVIPEDRRHFRALTDGGTVIVGRRTLLDFPGGKPLPGRRNIVLSRSSNLKIDGATVVTSLDELFSELTGTDPGKVLVIGGDQVFRQLLPYCTRAYVTKLSVSPDSDAFFPNLDALENWILEDSGTPNYYDSIGYSFQTYRNKSPLNTAIKK